MTRTRTVIVAMALALGLAGIGLWLGRGGLAAAPAAASPDGTAPKVASATAAVPPPRFAPPAAPDQPPIPLEEEGPGPHFEHYDGRSGRLSPHARPDEPYRPTEVTSTQDAPLLVAWMDPDRDGAPTLTIHARLVGAAIAEAAVQAELFLLERPERRVKVTLGPGQAAGTLVAVIPKAAPELQPPAAEGPVPPASVTYVVTATGSAGGEAFTRRAVGQFFLSDPGARLDERSAQVARVGPDLVLGVDVDVRRAGAYWVMAELFGGDGGARPIAFARQRLERLEPGRHRIELLFGGRVIRDEKIDGPYRIVNVRLAQPDTVPAHFAPFIRALPPTPAWRAQEFGVGG